MLEMSLPNNYLSPIDAKFLFTPPSCKWFYILSDYEVILEIKIVPSTWSQEQCVLAEQVLFLGPSSIWALTVYKMEGDEMGGFIILKT